MTFHGVPKASQQVMSKVHEAPYSMSIPMILLGIGAIFSGIFAVNFMTGYNNFDFWKESIVTLKANELIDKAHHLPLIVKYTPVFISIFGIILAWYFYIRRPEIPKRIADTNPTLYKFLLNKWYFDEIYNFLIVDPVKWTGKFLWKIFDGLIIDGLGTDGFASMILSVARKVSFIQTGLLYHYAFAMLIGIVLFVSLFLINL